MQKISLTIYSKEGIHARPASLFVNLATSFKSNITIIKNDNYEKDYAGKSILSVMTMAAGEGDSITIIADGEDEEIAINKLQALLETGI